MKKLLPILLFACFTGTSFADEQTLQIQSALAKAGFYYGNADGKMGEETRAALRRYQIRNGLDVSGEPSPETMASLKLQKKDAPVVAPSGAAAEDERQIASTVNTPDTYVAPKPAPQAAATPRTVSQAPVPVQPENARSPVREFYQGTDMAASRPSQQSTTLLQAQVKLRKLGLYKGPANGLPGTETEEALLRFQHSVRLRLTGQLDNDTRQALFNTPPAVPSRPFRSSRNRPDQRVFRGVWVQ
jgi:peptidoglycan hydrolase-like protein with peptidoglycan-binding domain